MSMCTVKEIREAIREDCRSQRSMETIEIDRIFQILTFPQLESLFDKPPMPPVSHRRWRRNGSGWKQGTGRLTICS